MSKKTKLGERVRGYRVVKVPGGYQYQLIGVRGGQRTVIEVGQLSLAEAENGVAAAIDLKAGLTE